MMYQFNLCCSSFIPKASAEISGDRRLFTESYKNKEKDYEIIEGAAEMALSVKCLCASKGT